MPILSDRTFLLLGASIIDPFIPINTSIINRNSPETPEFVKAISFGLSSYGYDLRLAPKLRLFKNTQARVIDPKEFDSRTFEEITPNIDGQMLLPPHSYALGMSYEYIRMPRNCSALCIGKSTYARCGLILNTTPLEPEWHGHITLEFANTAPLPIVLYAEEGICQMMLFEGDKSCLRSYADKAGKYQGQLDITAPKMAV